MLQDRYEIRKKLGEGAMGSTWLVYDRKLGMEWAMKTWKASDADEMINGEIRTLKMVDSRYFPRIVEFFLENGRQYLIMDRIQGITLEEKIRMEGRLPVREAVEITVQLCDALHHLHSCTPPVYHLDMKPSNIMLTQDGIRLIDFGSALRGWENMEAKTGTAGYASPEQMRGERVDARSDIFSLGAVLWTMLSGKRAGCGKMPFRVNRKLPDELCLIIRQAMSDEKEQRFISVQEMKKALLSAEEGGKLMKRVHRMNVCISLILFFLAVLGGAAVVNTICSGFGGGRTEWRMIPAGVFLLAGSIFRLGKMEKLKREQIKFRVEKEQLRTMKSSILWIDR